MSKAFRTTGAFIFAVSFAESFLRRGEHKVVGDSPWLPFVLFAATVTYVHYWHLQTAWEAGTIGPRDGWSAAGALLAASTCQLLAILASTDKASLSSDRTFTNLFALLVLGAVCVFADAIFVQERYKRAHKGLLAVAIDDLSQSSQALDR
jgi:hypothetical protein